MQTTPRDFQLVFLRKEQLSKDTCSFYFDRKGVDFGFLPGQYIRMTLAVVNPDNRGSARFFTIASSPLETDTIMITTRVLESSFKKTLASLPTGTAVQFFGPVGNFVFRQEEKQHHIFLAGGIGITPFHSMITYAAKQKVRTQITLFVSFVTVEDIVFYKELTKISEENKQIRIVYTLTQPELSTTSWSGETGRLSEDMLKKYDLIDQNRLYFVAGPMQMVTAMIDMLFVMKIPKEKVRKENFVGY